MKPYPTDQETHIAFFMASLSNGGIGKMRIHLTRELVKRGVKVDLLLGREEGPYFQNVDPDVRIVRLGTSHAVRSLPKLIRYLRREHPDVLVTERIRVNVAAIRARRFARVKTRIYAGIHTAMSREIKNLRPEKRKTHLPLMQRYYPQNDGYIAVSKGVAEDLVNMIDVPAGKIHVVYNPVVTKDLLTKAREPLDHPWFMPPGPPVILGTGRLEPQKDFPTLLHAFAAVRKSRSCRLVILGEGGERNSLEALASQLGIKEDLQLPGFVANPYAFMARADVFVLSSLWEGSPNVLTEALAVGTPVVSTDCRDGPKEILQNGRYGPLVSVGDRDALADAIAKTLDNPLAGRLLQSAVSRFTPEACADAYLEALGFGRNLAKDNH
ncbi:MAG: glycosyltransferase [Desulfatiglandaceae bacterium]